MRALYWNIRDVRKAAAKLALRIFIKEKHLEVVCIAKPMVEITIKVDWGQINPLLTFVHAKCLRVLRRDLWTELGTVAPLDSCPWLVVRDFNATLALTEKKGPGSFSQGSIAEFGAMVDACSLMAIPSQERKFTWTNNRKVGHVAAVLDRSFCNEAWLSVLGDSSQIVLTSTISDHPPILVVAEAIKRPANAPFRFQRFWLDHPNFPSVVEDSWKE
ncbi:uncharacterized protein LOC122665652 [Telopea speciosissima]|uniref:uncharacterized protein LOC122665652 n=1 Tax=Telopea speciosissima TaxID=54955 RepID=UPI001CC5474C|nr:uncharacterized protein LOC122665652 [Telopea speciosissima]